MKPQNCPVCGGRAMLSPGDQPYVSCGKCYMYGPECNSEAVAIAMWNCLRFSSTPTEVKAGDRLDSGQITKVAEAHRCKTPDARQRDHDCLGAGSEWKCDCGILYRLRDVSIWRRVDL